MMRQGLSDWGPPGERASHTGVIGGNANSHQRSEE